MTGATEPEYLAFAREANLDERLVRLIEQLAGVGRTPWVNRPAEMEAEHRAIHLCERLFEGSLSPHSIELLAAEQIALEEAIRSAFKNVTCIGGVTDGQAELLDRGYNFGYHTHEEYVAAGEKDRKRTWPELVELREWREEPGNWPFYDAIGLRFHLPAGMIRNVREGKGEFIAYTLERCGNESSELLAILTPDQRTVIVRFLLYMIAMCDAYGDDIYREGWDEAYRAGWSRFDQEQESH